MPWAQLLSLKTKTLYRTLFFGVESRIDRRGVDMKGTLFRHHQHYLGGVSLSLSENITRKDLPLCP